MSPNKKDLSKGKNSLSITVENGEFNDNSLYINQPPFFWWRTMIQRDANVSEKISYLWLNLDLPVRLKFEPEGMVFFGTPNIIHSTPRKEDPGIYILLLSALPTHIYIYAQSSKIPAWNVNFHEFSIPFLSSNNIAPENQWLEDIVSFWGPAYCQGQTRYEFQGGELFLFLPSPKKRWGQTKHPAIWRKNNL